MDHSLMVSEGNHYNVWHTSRTLLSYRLLVTDRKVLGPYVGGILKGRP